MARIIIWSGHHSREVQGLIQGVYHSADSLLILCPPRIKDISPWLSCLPSAEVSFAGEFEGQESFEHTSGVVFPEFPKFGLFSTGTVDGTKLILYSNKNFEASIQGIFSFFKDLPIKTIFSYPQPYHVFGLSLGYIASITQKVELTFPEGAYSREAHETWISTCEAKGKGLLTLGTPTHFVDALAYTEGKGMKVPSSLTSIAGGAKVEKKLWQLMRNSLHVNLPSIGYGCSEASPGVTHLDPGLEPEHDGDLGRILPNGKLLETVEGMVYEGENVCLAIIHNGSIHFPGGKYLLSDKLALDSRGHYSYLQRTGLVLNRGGEKFSLEEIESLLQKSLQMASVAIALDDQRLGQELGLVFEGDDSLKTVIAQKLKEFYSRNFDSSRFLAVKKLPVNANAKYDRQLCSQLLSRTSMTPVSELQMSLPHRDKMVWIDYVTEAREDGGTCLVRLNPEKHYFSSEGVRQSAFIEWMAQGYGFISAEFMRKSQVEKTLEKAFLVGVEKMNFPEKMPEAGEDVLVSVKTVRTVGPISYVEGRIHSATPEMTYCEALIKLFSI